MNNKFCKILRKYTDIVKMDYKRAKSVYNKLSKRNQKLYQKEIKQFVEHYHSN